MVIAFKFRVDWLLKCIFSLLQYKIFASCNIARNYKAFLSTFFLLYFNLILQF